MTKSLLYDELLPENGMVIAEVACGHEGVMDRADQLINAVAESESDLIKFQMFFTHERAKEGEKEWEIFDRLTFDESDWGKIIRKSRKAGLRILADVYGYESFRLAESLGVDGFKVHSEDLLNSFFIRDIAITGKLTLLGIGGSKRKELYDLLVFLAKIDRERSIVLMPGIQTFPTPLEAHSVQEVGEMVLKYAERFDVKIGFADHIDGSNENAFFLPAMALAKGAAVIEKHITIDRKDKWIDYQSALGSNDFRRFVHSIKKLAPLLGDVATVTSSEKTYRNMFKKTACARQLIEKGEVISPENIAYLKDVSAAIPISAIDVVGKSAARLIGKGNPINWNDIEVKVGAIIVVRMSSSRMPGKALRKIDGRESIRLVIDRIKKVENIQTIVLATSTSRDDDVLARIADEEGVCIYRGSLENVAERYFQTARHFNFDHFLRVTGDAILCDNVTADLAIRSHLESGNDITFIKNMPFGTAKEVISIRAIRAIVDNSLVPENTEYLEYFLGNEKTFNVGYVRSKYEFNKRIRITLDYEEDLEFFEHIYRHFNKGKIEFNLEDVILYLNDHPEVVDINSHKTQKYLPSDVYTGLRI